LKGSESGFTMSGKLFDLLSETIDLSLFATMCGALKNHCFDAMMDLNRKLVEADNAPQRSLERTVRDGSRELRAQEPTFTTAWSAASGQASSWSVRGSSCVRRAS
jgi:hypothetical protein